MYNISRISPRNLAAYGSARNLCLAVGLDRTQLGNSCQHAGRSKNRHINVKEKAFLGSGGSGLLKPFVSDASYSSALPQDYGELINSRSTGTFNNLLELILVLGFAAVPYLILHFSLIAHSALHYANPLYSL